MSFQNRFLDLSRYQILFPIGKGGFSQVYRIKNTDNNEYYAAKVSLFMVDEETKDETETLLIFREVNLISLLNHPSILKFIGYSQTDFENDPKPTIITEFATNGSLRNIIDMDISGLSPDSWDYTKKLINIYGIACGMQYLHANNIIHRDLKAENILMDEFLNPKIADFGLSKINDILSISMNFQSQKGFKGTPIYMAPEIFAEEKYSKASDVYSFAFIIFEIMTGQIPFKNFQFFQLIKKVSIQGFRPKIEDDVPNAYKELIERCWFQDPDERPSFDKIVDELKNNHEFITELIDESEFLDYVDYIDNYKSSFNKSNQLIHFDEFIKVHGRKKFIRKVEINKLTNETIDANEKNESHIEITSSTDVTQITKANSENNDTQSAIKPLKIINKDENDDFSSKVQPLKIVENDDLHSTTKPLKIIEKSENDENQLYPLDEFYTLDKDCQELVQQAFTDSRMQFIVGKNLIEGKNNFHKNVELGLKYLEKSRLQKYMDSIIYIIKMCIKGDKIQQDIEKAKKYLQENVDCNNSHYFVLNGQIYLKEKKYTDALNCFEQGVKSGNNEAMYRYAKMLFLGKGTKKNSNEAFNYFTLSANNGNQKSHYFINAINIMNQYNDFKLLPVETQYILISRTIKNMENIIENDAHINQIKIEPNDTEILFFNSSFRSHDLYKCLSLFKKAFIEVQYPSNSFDNIIDLIIKIKKR